MRDNAPRPLTRRDFLKASYAMLWYGMLSCARPGLATAAASVPPRIFWHGSRHLPYVSITFDDCYHSALLQDLERSLEAYPSIRVTFFPVGIALINTTSRDPQLWKRLLGKGHEIGYHGYAHEYPGKLSSAQMLSDFDKWLEACTQVLGEVPMVRFARPPYGDLSYSFLNLCVEQNLIPAMWSAIWAGALENARRKMARVRNGDIILLHVRYQDIENAREALPIVQSLSLRAVTLSKLYSASEEDDASEGCVTSRFRHPSRPCME